MLQVLSSTILLLLLLQFHSSVAQPSVMVEASPVRVSEGETFTVTFTLSESPELSDFIINLAPVQQGAGVGQFGPIQPSVLTFEQGTTDLTRSVQIQVLIDDVFETEKITPTFVATPTYNGTTLPQLPPTDGQVFVEDSIYIGFKEVSYTFLENTTNQVCVMISATIPGASVFSVNVAYSSDVAVEDVDYTVGETSILFSSSTINRTECVTLTILEDNDFERTEVLTATLSGNITVNPEGSTASISIIDLDANCGAPPQGDDLTVTVEPYAQDALGNIVTNQGAIATYTCNDQNLILNGTSQLTCVLMNETDAVWYPQEPPTCVEPEMPLTTTTAMTIPRETLVTTDETTGDVSRSRATDGAIDGAPPTHSSSVLLSIVASMLCLLYFS